MKTELIRSGLRQTPQPALCVRNQCEPAGAIDFGYVLLLQSAAAPRLLTTAECANRSPKIVIERRRSTNGFDILPVVNRITATVRSTEFAEGNTERRGGLES